MEHSSSPAPALTRGLELLEQLAQDGQQPLEQLAARNQWPKSSVLRCLKTLEMLRLVEQDASSKHWRALARVQPLTSPKADLVRNTADHLPFLAEQTGQCVELYEVLDQQVELMDRADPEGSEIVVQARIGSTRDLAELDATATLVYAFNGHSLPQPEWFWAEGEQAPIPAEQRARMITRAKETHLAIDHSFNQHGIRRFAVPLLEQEKLVGILAVAQRLTPRFRPEAERIQEVLNSYLEPVPERRFSE